MRHVAIALFLLGCQGLDAETSDEGLDLDAPPAKVDFARSFVITDHTTLAKINPGFRVGDLLIAENHYLQTKKTDSDFAIGPFKSAGTDVDNHNNYGGKKVGTVPFIVNAFTDAILPTYDPGKTEPFHLIAVVNRLDLAGDMDMRAGGVLAGGERRWFGEGRLVYAVDGTVRGKPYPMTVIMEFRLPALKRNANGTIVLDDSFVFAAGPKNEKDWTARRELWALVWQDLSSVPLGSDAYVQKLDTIISWFAYNSSFAQRGTTKNAKNHLAIRTGERVQDSTTMQLTDEFEYREFYLDANLGFATRKLRREPFACANKSQTLADRIDNEWVGTDLAWDYMLGPRGMTTKETNEVTQVCGNELPYGQQDDGQPAELRAKFDRFKPSSVWAVGQTSEAKIHSFATGSCTGCHAGETATVGFQIAPPASGTDAVLSPFLTGPLTVTPRGASYTYDEPTRRKSLVAHFANGDVVDDDPLLQDIDCNDVSDCTIP